MSEATPTRAVVLELKDEQRAMHEGYAFLDEKCLLLAGEILRELEHHAQLDVAMLAAHQVAVQALRAAVARHGLADLQVYPALDQSCRHTRARRALDHGCAPPGRHLAIIGRSTAAVGSAIARGGSMPARIRRADCRGDQARRRLRQSRAPFVRVSALGTPRARAAGCLVARTRPRGVPDRIATGGTRTGRRHLDAASDVIGARRDVQLGLDELLPAAEPPLQMRIRRLRLAPQQLIGGVARLLQ